MVSVIDKIKKSLLSLKWYETLMCFIMIGISVYYAIKPIEGCPQWLAIINLISGICGVICIFLCAKANRVNFLFAMVNTVVYMIYLFYFKIWATFWLEAIVYFPVNIISWIAWSKHKDEEDNLLAKTKRLNVLQTKIATLTNWNIEIMKWLDSAIFAIGIIAVIMELLRYSEQYVLWLITDFVSVAQYVIKGDPVYITKRVIYTVEAFVGLKNWVELAKKNRLNE